MIYCGAKDEAGYQGTLRSHNVMVFPRMHDCGGDLVFPLKSYQERKMPNDLANRILPRYWNRGHVLLW